MWSLASVQEQDRIQIIVFKQHLDHNAMQGLLSLEAELKVENRSPIDKTHFCRL